MMTSHYANINLLWGSLLLEELVRLGVTDICIAPGSRSTPLTLAACNHPALNTHCHFDERGLGFFALGLAKSTGKAVVVITTSGTAVANLHPALIEAKLSNVPLIILSADRPDELYDCGANQAISQQGIFAAAVVKQVNLPTASEAIAPNFVLSTIDQMYAAAQQQLGPVHVNCRYREPLYPESVLVDFSEYLTVINRWRQNDQPYTQYISPHEKLALANHQCFAELDGRKGLVICGQVDQTAANELALWAKQLGWPLLSDCQSSLQGHPESITYYDQLLHNEGFSKSLAQADIIIQFGARLVSKRLLNFIKKTDCDYWLVTKGQQRLDPDHRLTRRFAMSPEQWLAQVSNIKGQAWGAPLASFNQKITDWLTELDNTLPQLSEYSVMRALPQLLPTSSTLFLGNSMPVRLFDMFAPMAKSRPQIYTNRGASGIDGILACAAGVAKGLSDCAHILVLGDTSLLHDLNSLALLANRAATLAAPFVIIVLNNDGGAIFNMLPVPDAATREAYYQMPHGLNFKAAAKMFGLDYVNPHSQQGFAQHLKQCLSVNNVSLIEITVPATETTDLVVEISKQINANAFL